MGILAKTNDDRGVKLSSQFLIGSSTNCDLRVLGARVAPHHAELIWQDNAWTIRDLGSSGGTFVNGEPVDWRSPTRLARGDAFGFGDPAPTHRLVDASPPGVFARNINTGEILEPSGEELLLSAPGESPVRVTPGVEPGSWLVCRGGRLTPVASGEVIGVASQVYALHLPGELTATRPPPTISSIELTLRVSKDEKFVEVWLRDADDNVSVMPPRAHYHTMLLLARMRVEDRRAARLPALDQGWRSVAELCEMLSVEESRLNVDIYRIRSDVAKLGLINAKDVIQRRRSRRIVRLGVARVSVCEM